MGRFRIQFEDRDLDLPAGELVIGRGVGCHIRLRSPSVSRRHLRILVAADTPVAFDLGSRNGSYVNGEKLEGPKTLHDGDVLRVASQSFKLRELGPEEEWEQEPETWETGNGAAPRESSDARKALARVTAKMSSGDWDGVRDTVLPITEDVEAEGEESLAAAEGVATGPHRCASCGATVAVGSLACPRCGAEPYSAPQYRTCAGCRTLISQEDDACPKCGLERIAVARDGEAAEAGDRRAAPRRPLNIRGLYVSSSLTFDAEVSDISRGGIFMASELLDPVGTKADVVLSTEDRGGARFVGEVVRVVTQDAPGGEATPGMGIKFIGVMPAARQWLDGYLAEAAG